MTNERIIKKVPLDNIPEGASLGTENDVRIGLRHGRSLPNVVYNIVDSKDTPHIIFDTPEDKEAYLESIQT